jgi:DNA-binding NtrC family response regulator
VRELEYCVQRSLLLCRGELITEDDLWIDPVEAS